MINMAFVGIVLIAVFAAVCITSYQSLKSDIYHSLQLATEQRADKLEPPAIDEKRGNFPKQNLIAVCTVTVDDSGIINSLFKTPLSCPMSYFPKLQKQLLKQKRRKGVYRHIHFFIKNALFSAIRKLHLQTLNIYILLSVS